MKNNRYIPLFFFVFSVANTGHAIAQQCSGAALAAKQQLTQLLGQYSGSDSVIDNLNAQYDAMKFGTKIYMQVPNLSWTEMTMSDQTASNLLGMADNRCEGQPPTSSLQRLGMPATSIAAFSATRAKVCKLIQVTAGLKTRYDQLQQIMSTGIVLVEKSKSEGKDFHGFHRTIGMGMSLTYIPSSTAISSGTPNPTVLYKPWVKWSDDNPTYYTPLPKLIQEFNGGGHESCPGFCIPLLTGNVKADFCTNVTNVTATTVTLQNCVAVHYKTRDAAVNIPSYTVSAPFGYLAEVETMKDSAKASLKQQAEAQLINKLNLNSQMVEKLNTAVACMSAN